MKKAGIYCMIAVAVIFIVLVLYILTSRYQSPILLQHNSATNIINSTSANADTISAISSNKLNINTATTEELEMLPGIGEALAQRIVSYRTKNGNFKNIDALLEVTGIGQTKLDAIKDYITTG